MLHKTCINNTTTDLPVDCVCWGGQCPQIPLQSQILYPRLRPCVCRRQGGMSWAVAAGGRTERQTVWERPSAQSASHYRSLIKHRATWLSDSAAPRNLTWDRWTSVLPVHGRRQPLENTGVRLRGHGYDQEEYATKRNVQRDVAQWLEPVRAVRRSPKILNDKTAATSWHVTRTLSPASSSK